MELTINSIYRYKSSKSSYLDFRFKFLGMGEGCLKNWHHYINMDTGEKPARRKRGRPKSAKTIERDQRKKEQEERRMMEQRRAQILIQQQQEQQRRERNRQKAISVFAGVLAAAAVIGVIFVGIGALGLLAFFGAGGMLAEAD